MEGGAVVALGFSSLRSLPVVKKTCCCVISERDKYVGNRHLYMRMRTVQDRDQVILGPYDIA